MWGEEEERRVGVHSGDIHATPVVRGDLGMDISPDSSVSANQLGAHQ